MSVVTGWFGNSGRTIPVRTRNWPAVTISLISTRRARSCNCSRPVSSSTATTVIATATHGGNANATAPSK
ncbi:MAG TPA: hypothetical protein VHZ64_17160 [Xanthobacteraceae bacterium]|nr:hypothetical protein [Xanthobacteraceae bacterium]